MTGRAEPLLEVAALEVSIDTDAGTIPILRDVGFTVGQGESVGIVGESGSGKSMTLRTIARLNPRQAHQKGTVRFRGEDLAAAGPGRLRELRRNDLGFIFQDPRVAINPMHRVGDFLIEVVRDAGGDLTAARARAEYLLQRMGITDGARRMRQYPFELSGGLLQRVMIAAALMAEPALLLADEATTALDVTTQSDALALVRELLAEQDTAMLFVTHDLDLALAVCDRVLVLYAGQVMEIASADELARGAGHPYTRGLLASRPPLERRVEPMPIIPGAPTALADALTGCPFRSRCPAAIERCERELPVLHHIGGRSVRCHRAEEIMTGSLDDLLPARPPEDSAANPVAANPVAAKPVSTKAGSQ